MHILLLLQIVSVFSSLEKMTTGGKKEKKKTVQQLWPAILDFSLFFVSFFSVNFSIKKITLNFVLKIHVCGMGLAIGKIL